MHTQTCPLNLHEFDWICIDIFFRPIKVSVIDFNPFAWTGSSCRSLFTWFWSPGAFAMNQGLQGGNSLGWLVIAMNCWKIQLWKWICLMKCHLEEKHLYCYILLLLVLGKMSYVYIGRWFVVPEIHKARAIQRITCFENLRLFVSTFGV